MRAALIDRRAAALRSAQAVADRPCGFGQQVAEGAFDTGRRNGTLHASDADGALDRRRLCGKSHALLLHKGRGGTDGRELWLPLRATLGAAPAVAAQSSPGAFSSKNDVRWVAALDAIDAAGRSDPGQALDTCGSQTSDANGAASDERTGTRNFLEDRAARRIDTRGNTAGMRIADDSSRLCRQSHRSSP
jgi:hypothetical protein